MAEQIRKISPQEDDFPPLLREIPGPPRQLFLRGRLPDFSLPHVAIVGTRRATPDGKLLAKRIAKELATEGVVIVSGLALGIDGAAHEGALGAGGKTVAVLANGLDEIYPHTHENLAEEILEKDGALVSEYPVGTPSYRNQFLERNRIISGLSLATVIIEAPIHSGALVTARHALDQGREVFVAAGPALHQNYRGSHVLLRHGARLITSAADIIEDLNLPTKADSKIKEITDPTDLVILKILNESPEPLPIDKIIERTKLETHIVNQHLTFLMFEGLVMEKDGSYEPYHR